MDIFPKFIIEDGCIILSKCTFHSQLVTDKTKVNGGGWFRYIPTDHHFIFHGDSNDFGKAKLEDIKKCVKEGKVYRNRSKMCSIVENNIFSYDTGSEIINLEK